MKLRVTFCEFKQGKGTWLLGIGSFSTFKYLGE